MPCDSGYGSSSDYDSHFLRDGKTAELLCSVLQLEESAGRLSHYSVQVRAWWADHKARDKKRVKEELAATKEAGDKKAALKKLTPYERKLLNIRND